MKCQPKQVPTEVHTVPGYRPFVQPEGECTNCGRHAPEELERVTVVGYDAVVESNLCPICIAALAENAKLIRA